VPNSSTANGTQVQLYDCSAGSNQLWTSTSSKQLTVYGDKCLGANRSYLYAVTDTARSQGIGTLLWVGVKETGPPAPRALRSRPQ
jgi:hypothetical protein